jgi:hypothetical protein
MIVVPMTYLRLEVDANLYEPPCGRGAFQRALGSDGAVAFGDVFTQPCYRLAPGAHREISIRARSNETGALPTGMLRVAVDRGRLERTEIALDGTQDAVTFGYDAPDETIRVSVRVFLEGHSRGKAQLHLVPKA